MNARYKLKGVLPAGNRFRGQLVVRGTNYYLGTFDSEQDAARAVDNAAYHLSLTGHYRSNALNYPQDFAGDSVPAPTERTQELLQDVEARYGSRSTLHSKLPKSFVTPVTALEACDSMLAQVSSLRAALAAATRLEEDIKALRQELDYNSEEGHKARKLREWCEQNGQDPAKWLAKPAEEPPKAV